MVDYIEWIKVIVYATGILMILIIAEVMKRHSNIPVAITRKLVHFGVGILTFLTPFIFKDRLPLILIAVLFVVVNAVTYYFNFFKGLSAQRRTIGTVIFPFSFLILLIFAWDNHPYLIAYGIGLMTFADGFASVVGERIKKPHIFQILSDRKSCEGSFTLFLTTLLLTQLFYYFEWLDFPRPDISIMWWLLLLIVMGILAVCLEAVSVCGSDNLTLPLLGSLFFYVLLMGQVVILIQFIAAFTIFLLFGLVFYYKKWLAGSGVIPMVMIALIIIFLGDWRMIFPMVLFFLTSSLLSKAREKYTAATQRIEQKDSRRDSFQVVANGSVAALVAISFYFYPHNLIIIIYCSVIAAITADTWSTEIGYFSKKEPVSILTLSPVLKGTSGGVTWVGLAGGGLGAIFIALCSMIIFPERISFVAMLIIIIAGFSGTIIDSVLGSTVQVKYKCPKCLAIVENKFHCSETSLYETGIHFIDNDWVNWISSGLIALVSWIIVVLV